MISARWFQFILIFMILFTICGCSGDGPITPDPQPQFQSSDNLDLYNNFLWGYFDVEIDPEKQTVSTNLNRHALTTWNIIKALDTVPASLSFEINSLAEADDYWDVDVDVSITHPYTGVEKFNAYGVRGILLTDGTTEVPFENNLFHGDPETDQTMLVDPVNNDGGGPDGYTRWFNPTEFYIPGLLGYFDGEYNSPGYIPAATLNPYKFFADGLGSQDDLWDFLINSDTDGLFSAGATNTRNYYIRFPKSKGLKFSYAIAAVWDGPNNHPARIYDPVGVNVEMTDELWYESSTQNGGYLHLDISIFDWGEPLTEESDYGGKYFLKDFRVIVTSPIFGSVYVDTGPDVTGGTANYSTCQVDINQNSIETPGPTYFWVAIRRWAHDYSNEYGVHNYAAGERLSTYYKFEIDIDEEHTNFPPHCSFYVSSTPPWTELPYSQQFYGSNCSDPNGDQLTYEWDFDGDGIFSEDPDDNFIGDPEDPMHIYDEDYEGPVTLRVDDNHGGVVECSKDFDFNYQLKNNLPLREDATAFDLAAKQQSGDLLILYDDGQVWKYTYDEYYFDGTFFFQVEVGADRIAISHDGNIIVGGNQEGTLEWAGSYDSLGNLIQEHHPVGRIYDVIGYEGDIPACHGFLCDTYQPGFDFAAYLICPPLYSEPTAVLKINKEGPGKIDCNLIVGIESCSYSTDRVYVLEKGPEFRLECFIYDFDTTCTSIGGEQSDFNGFWDPIDITSSGSSKNYVLDILSTGETAIKQVSYSGPYYYTYVDNGKISGEPLRIDSADIDEYMLFILHTDGLTIIFPRGNNWV